MTNSIPSDLEISDLEIQHWVHLNQIADEPIDELLAGGEPLENLESAGLFGQWEFAQEETDKTAGSLDCFEPLNVKTIDLNETDEF